MPQTPLTLIYWPTLPGRGEYVRLLLEALRLDYTDLGRLEGVGAVAGQREAVEPGPPAFAPPMLLDASTDPPRRIAQTAAILLYLDDVYGPFGASSGVDRYAKTHAMLTVMDVVAEAHDTHHPLDVTKHFEDQQEAAVERARVFQRERIPKFLGLFEAMARSMSGGPGPDGLLGGRTYVDLALAHTIRGLEYAFPAATARALDDTPTIRSIADSAFAEPAVAAYRASDRCLPFDQTGIFRFYDALQETS